MRTNNLYYFRDNIGNEVDLLLDYGQTIVPIEIKSSQTINDAFFKNLSYYQKLNPHAVSSTKIIYAGAHSYQEHTCEITSYQDM